MAFCPQSLQASTACLSPLTVCTVQGCLAHVNPCLRACTLISAVFGSLGQKWWVQTPCQSYIQCLWLSQRKEVNPQGSATREGWWWLRKIIHTNYPGQSSFFRSGFKSVRLNAHLVFRAQDLATGIPGISSPCSPFPAVRHGGESLQ